MRKYVLGAFLCFLAFNLNAATTRIDFSGSIIFGTINDTGNFNGTLLADWDTGRVYEFYANVTYITGEVERYSIFSNYDAVNVIQGSDGTRYWSDGSIDQYSVVPELEFSVSRYHRGLDGNLTVVPDPDWEMFLEISPRGLWGWIDSEYQIIPCSSPSGYCWDVVSEFHAFGTIELISSTVVPIPAAIWLFGSGLLGLIGVARRRASA